MKYINQINFVLAALGIIIVGYALSQTLLAPAAQSKLDLDELRQMQPRVIESPEISDAPAALMSSTTTARSAVREAAPSARPERPAAQPTIAGRNAPAPAPAPTPPSRRNTQAPRTPSTPVWLGDPSARSDSGGSGVARPRSSAVAGQPGLPSGNQGRATGSLVRPPAGVEGVKRDGSADPPAPPMRSSMPQTAPRRP